MIRRLEHAWDDEIEQMVNWFEGIACNCEVCWEDVRVRCEQEWKELAIKIINLILSTKLQKEVE